MLRYAIYGSKYVLNGKTTASRLPSCGDGVHASFLFHRKTIQRNTLLSFKREKVPSRIKTYYAVMMLALASRTLSCPTPLAPTPCGGAAPCFS